MFNTMKSEIKMALQLKKKIIYVDESMFTTAQRLSHAYSNKNINIRVNELTANIQALAVVAGVSDKRGVEAYFIKPKSINSNSFIEFLELLLQNNNPLQTVLFMDNCAVHRSRKVTEFCKLLGLQMIFNVPYCPQYNPIERVWAIAKNLYKRSKLKQISYKNPKKHEKLVRESIESISETSVKSICEKTLQKEVLGNE